MFEIDSAGATINPLHKRQTPVLRVFGVLSTGAPSEDDDAQTYKFAHALRALFFVLIPQCVWLLEDVFAESHFVMLVYIQVVYVVVLQSALVETFVKGQQKTRVRLILCLMGLLYIVTGIVLRTPHIVIETVDVAGNCECGDCEYFTTEDISKGFYPSFFSSRDKVMGIGAEVDGVRLSRSAIIDGMSTVEQHLPLIFQYSGLGIRFPDECSVMLSNTIASYFLRPCIQSCIASNLSTSSCNIFMEDCDPSFLENVDFDAVWDILNPLVSGVSVLGSIAESAAAIGLMEQAVKGMALLPRDKSSFCASPMFDVGTSTAFRCVDNGASKETRSFSHTPAKASWASTPVLVWALLTRFRPQYKSRKGTYSMADMSQLSLCFLFLIALGSILLQKLSVFEGSAVHGVGLVFLVVSYIWCSAMFALWKGKSSREINTKVTNYVLRLYSAFRVLTDVNDGKYYFVYAFVLEVVEIIVQLRSFDVMVRTNDLSYVRSCVTIISLNLILAPMSLLALRSDQQCWRRLVYITDTLLESAYLFLNLNIVREGDLAKFAVLLSILFPLLSLLAKVDTFIEATTTFVKNKERRDSWVRKSWMQNAFKVKRVTKKGKRTVKRKLTVKSELTAKQKIRIRVVGMLTSGFGVFVFVYMMSSANRIDAQCGETIGVEVWENARPRYVFADGPLLPKCNFDSIKEVRAHQKGIKKLRKEIGLLTSAVHLDLSGNRIESLPIEIAELTALKHVNMEGNPVWTFLDWHDQDLDNFPDILRFFTKLERLNLGHNHIKTVPDSIGHFQRLSELVLRNNSIFALSQKVTQLALLTNFDVRYNPVATSLSWQGVEPDGAVRIFRFMGELVELDISNGKFESVSELLLALPRLQWLNVSSNLLKAVVSIAKNHVRGLDISNNLGMFNFVWWDNGLDSIKMKGLFNLKTLSLQNNNLESIDLNDSTALVRVSLAGNQLQSIDLSRLTALTYMSLDNNTLHSIDVTGLINLAYLKLRGNQNLKSIKNISGLNRTKTEVHM
jgi:Leucine-rich repeat (LRR) protein